MVDLQGKTIDQYQVIELINETDRELIYKGFQPNTNRYVALAVLKSQASYDVQTFTQQTELLAQIEHPNILPIISSGIAEGHAYRALRYSENGVLRDHLFAYRDPRQAAGLIAGIVAGLEKIHAQGTVHGNLKPDNIYLEDAGHPLLTDFGLPQSSGTSLTPYLSPEQTQGGLVDRRTDVYALGVLLYTMLTGEAPPPGVVVSLRAKRPDLSRVCRESDLEDDGTESGYALSKRARIPKCLICGLAARGARTNDRSIRAAQPGPIQCASAARAEANELDGHYLGHCAGRGYLRRHGAALQLVEQPGWG